MKTTITNTFPFTQGLEVNLAQFGVRLKLGLPPTPCPAAYPELKAKFEVCKARGISIVVVLLIDDCYDEVGGTGGRAGRGRLVEWV